MDAFDKRVARRACACWPSRERNSRSRRSGQSVIPGVRVPDGHLHTVQLPLAHPRSGDVVGVIHLRVRCTRLNEHVVAADKDFNPDASLLTAPSTYTKQFALNAADVLASGASGVASVARAGLGTINPLPKKYVDGAANGISRAALAAVNAPAARRRPSARCTRGARRCTWARRRTGAEEEDPRELEAAGRGYSEALQASEQAASAEHTSASAGPGPRRAAAARERRRGERARDAPRETFFGARGRVPERGLARGGRARRDGHGARR